MKKLQFDVAVLGAGPAGESAAINAAKHGARVVILDDKNSVGGNCTHLGTIPSKTLRSFVNDLIRFGENPVFHAIAEPASISFPTLMAATQDVVREQVKMRYRFYQRNRISVMHGKASFISSDTIELLQAGGVKQQVTAKKIVIATGSRPYHPDDIDFSHSRIYDSDTILSMDHTPTRLIIYGAGVIGCEYASIFSGIGVKVELINTRDSLLEFLDTEISDALSYHLRDYGVMVRDQETCQSVEVTDHGVTMNLESGKKVHGDALLWCNGRKGNTELLDLAKAGLTADHRGYITVDEHYQTVVEHIFAAGDVVGWPSLASAAYNQGRAASATARGKENCHYVDDVPTGIYTIPAISSIGSTEKELTAQKVSYEVGRAFFKDTARGQISGEKVGVLKILFHSETLEVLGVHCFGAAATEIIHIGQAIMKQKDGGNNIRYFVDNTFNYPTMAEAYRIAALNGLNRLH